MLYRFTRKTGYVALLLLPACLPWLPVTHELPDGFVYLQEVAPAVQTEIRYHGSDNFIGRPIDGYEKPVCILTVEAAAALKAVNDDLRGIGLGLMVYDAYRPQRAVNHFIRWAKNTADNVMKDEYYPDVNKENLFRDGYIAEQSGHSRGSTVDVTLVSLEPDATGAIDMGSSWDHFGPVSWPDYPDVTPEQRSNRLLLQERMIKHGFQPIREEWWHFTLKDEPFPATYFDFPVR